VTLSDQRKDEFGEGSAGEDGGERKANGSFGKRPILIELKS